MSGLLPTPRKSSAACFDAFRGLGNVQRRVLMLSDPSETFSGAFWYFPSPRAVRDVCQVCRVRAFEFSEYGFLRYPASFPAPAGAVRDACQVCRVRVRCLACFRPLGNLQRRVLTLPRPRKRSAACFDAFRPLGNLQRRVLTLSEASETFSGEFWYFPRPRGGFGRRRSWPSTHI